MFRYLTKGKRGKIYVEGNTAIKKSLPKRVKNESSWLKILNKYGIDPKLIEVKKNYRRILPQPTTGNCRRKIRS